MRKRRAIFIRLTDSEYNTIAGLAEREKLSPSTFVRRQLLLDFDHHFGTQLPSEHNRAGEVLPDSSAVVA